MVETRSAAAVREQTACPRVPPLPQGTGAREAFQEGVSRIFAGWTALRLAVNEEWGGPTSKDKEQWLLQEAVQWCYSTQEHYADELEEELDDALLKDFNVEAEDNSPSEVAQAIIQLYHEISRGEVNLLQRLRAQAGTSGPSGSRRQVVDRDGTDMGEGASSSSSDDEDDDDAMDEDDKPAPPKAANKPPPPAPIIDEDGFEMVQKGRRR